MKKFVTGALLSLFALGTSFAQNLKVKAYYSGYDKELDIYSFDSESGDYLEFEEINPDILSKYALKTKEAGKAFSLEYTIKNVEDEDGEEVEVYKLLKLAPTTIINKEEEDEDEE